MRETLQHSIHSSAIVSSGYSIARNVFKQSTLDTVTTWLKSQELPEQACDTSNKFHSGATVINNLHAKELFFWDLISHPTILQVCDELLNPYSFGDNEGYSILGSAIRSIQGPQDAQQLHIDSNLPGCNHILSLQFCIPLTPFNKESGSTQIVLGSQDRKEYPPNKNELDEATQSSLRLLEAQPGDLIMFNAGLWHGSSQKFNSDPRSAIFLRYGRWFLKQSYDIANHIPDHIYSKLSDVQLALAGAFFQPPFDDSDNRGRKSNHPVLRRYITID